MGEAVVSSIMGVLANVGKVTFKGVRGKIKAYRIKVTLKREIESKLLRQYGNEMYYHHFDGFIINEKVIPKLIENNINTNCFNYKSKSEVIKYYVQLFLEKYPEYKIYSKDFYGILGRCFEIIFKTLNKYETEEIRTICNVAQELFNDLKIDNIETQKTVLRIEEKVDNYFNDKIPGGINDIKYLDYIMHLYQGSVLNTYIDREIYETDKLNDKMSSYEFVLKEKRVLLLGEAGYGKTYESLQLLNKVCENYAHNKLLPIYIPLLEYGTENCSDLFQGIKRKLEDFCTNNIELT